MKNKIKEIIFIFFLSTNLHAYLIAVPGEIIAIQLNEKINKLHDNDLIINFNGNEYAILPVPYSANGTVIKKGSYSIKVKKKDFGESRITISNPSMVDLSKSDSDRAYKESLLIKKALNTFTNSISPSFNFISPVEGIISSRYGKKRFINDKPRSPHLALDIAATEGTTIIAPSSGRIILVGDFFYSGKYIMLDHGKGLISSYSHMSEISVSIDTNVRKGDILGKVGSTGRVTGPHLHWSVYLNKERINPESLLKENYLDLLLKSSQDII
jgi:murein DD-endopeptidase MepM/ murein hydrolase activator NlpD